MNIKQTRTLSAFIFSSFLDADIRATEASIEQCSRLCSVKDFQSVKKIVGQIDAPVARLYEVIAEQDYGDPEAFVIQRVPDFYKSRVYLSVAIGSRMRGDLLISGRMLKTTRELARKHNNLVALYQAEREEAILHSLDGNHKHALEILKETFPLARQVFKTHPAYFFAYLNSVAVELGEVGQLDRARYFINLALASPYASAYPEWIETRDELLIKGLRASRSVVSIGRIEKQNNAEPIREHCVIREVPDTTSPQKAKVFQIEEWNRIHMSEKITRQKPFDPRTRKEKLKEVYSRMVDDPPTEDQLDQILGILDKKKDSDAKKT